MKLPVLFDQESSEVNLDRLERRARELPYPVVAVTEPCGGCGKEIQPGQLYVPKPRPHHLGCIA